MKIKISVSGIGMSDAAWESLLRAGILIAVLYLFSHGVRLHTAKYRDLELRFKPAVVQSEPVPKMP